MNAGFILLFIFLVLFPFGQLLRNGFPLIDFVVGTAFLYSLFFRLKLPKILSPFWGFFAVAVFSFLLSVPIFNSPELIFGLLYLIRLLAYVYFVVFIASLVKGKVGVKNKILNSLIVVSLFSAVLGWVQYFFIPDLRPLFLLGWDDHLFRLAGTFLDPGFAGIIFVLGGILTLYKYNEVKRIGWFLLFIFFALTTAFTYSRASYLALGAGVLAFGYLTKRVKISILLILAFMILLVFLPRPGSEGVQLERTKSVTARVESYKDSFRLSSIFPLFGVGYNNLCLARQTFLAKGNFASHSCSGIDSSLLTILATTGVAGLISFAWFVLKTMKMLPRDYFGGIVLSSGISVGVHSFFVNSLFYPWVMAWMAIVLALSIKKSN